MMNSMKKAKILLIMILLLAAGCQNVQASAARPAAQEPAAPQLTTSTATPEAQAEVQPTTIQQRNPLTGQMVDENQLQRMPVMVKVSNYPREGRPHAGLSFADIVFDYYIGFGTNRFLAIYYGADSPQIGPVRSGRLVDAELVMLYNGILGYGSADEDTDAYLMQALGERAISYQEAPCPAFCGTDTHSVVGVFAGSADITRFALANGIDSGAAPALEGMYFDEVIPRDGIAVEQINILFNFYNRAEWKYDLASGSYLRWIEEMEDEEEENSSFQMVPLLDRVTGEQLAFHNVIILFTHYTENAPSEHEIDIMKNIEGKRAVFYRDGYMFEGTWRVPDDRAPIQFFDQNGSPFQLKPGNSWIVLADENSIFNRKQSGAWELFFLLSPDA